MHRRLEKLDPTDLRLNSPEKLVIIPLPNAGGPFPMVRETPEGPRTTAEFTQVVRQLQAIEDLKLVVFDPLSSFVHADVNADPAVGSYLTGLLANLASETGATVIIVHHMRKPPGTETYRKRQSKQEMPFGEAVRWWTVFEWPTPSGLPRIRLCSRPVRL